LTLAPTLYMLQVFDRVLISRSQLTLLALSLVLLFFVALLALSEWLRSLLLVRVGVRLDKALGPQVFNAAFAEQLARPSAVAARPVGDLTVLRQFVTGPSVIALFDAPWSLLYVLVLWVMHPLLGGLGLVFVLVQAVVAWLGHRLVTPAQGRLDEVSQRDQAFLGSKLRNAETVRALGMQGGLRRLWLVMHEQQALAVQAAVDRSQRLVALTKLVQYLQQALVLAAGAWLVLQDQLTAGGMVAAGALMTSALRPVAAIASTWRQTIDARLAYQRLAELARCHPVAQKQAMPAQVHGQVSLRGLVAMAAGREAPILGGLDADFRAGEVVAIVGPSGAGKSTLARCLVGVWPDQQGQVLIDGYPTQDWDREQLGPAVGFLAQDVELLEGTVAENISRFGAVDPQTVIEAATLVGIHELILRMPQGYDTPMAMAGAQLSGGYRQRIGLARAFYGWPALVVLDEPTAHLDDVGLHALQQAVQRARDGGSTVFMVLHQRQLLQVATTVLELNGGLIVHQGPAPAKRS
jgi:ATP-binding cassette, subfamily C, bacterial exporter for protease/lipase